MLQPVILVKVADGDSVGGGMNKFVIGQVHAHVRDTAYGIEEDKVALSKVGHGDMPGHAILLMCRAWKADAVKGRKKYLHESGAIYALLARASQSIACAQ